MKKCISLILTILIVFSSILTVSASSSAGGSSGGGGGGSSIGGVVVYPTISSGFVCQNQYSTINFDTGEITIKNSPVELYDDVILKGDEVLCPARSILEKMQFAVNYNAFESSIIATLDDITMSIPLDGNTITVNGVNYYSKYPAETINGVQYIPVASVLNALGYVEVSVGIGVNIITYAESCVTYRLLGNGTMTIEGIGVIPNYAKTEVKPWDDFASRIKKIVIDDGVSAIGNYTFNNCENLISVELPDTVTKINKYAFPNTTSFTKINYKGAFEEWNLISDDENSNTKYVIITYSDGYVDYAPADDFEVINGVIVSYLGEAPVVHIPDEIDGVKITKLGSSVFEGNRKCYHITIPDTVTMIGELAFDGCTKLRSVNIPNGVTELKDNTFCSCESLNSIILPKALTKIGNGVFSNCTSLTSIDISNITSLGEAALECTGLLEISVPEGITSIPRLAFRNCSSLTNVELPQGLETIEMDAFSMCESLTDIIIPSTVRKIYSNAFEGCSNLKEIELPSVETISGNSFKDCYRLQNIIIPNSVTTIISDAFMNCYSLTNVYYKGSESDWQNITIYENNEYLTDATIHYNYTGTSECIVEFNTNGGNGYFSPLTVTAGSTVELPEDVFTREHHKFLGWAFTSSAIEAELLPLDEYTVEESIVFYAVWEPLPYIETTIDEYTNYSLGTTKIYNAPSNCVLNIAAYSEGRLVSLESRPYTKSTETYAITEDYDTIKIMLWSGLTNLKPLCDANCISKAVQEFLTLCNSTGDYLGVYNALNSDIYDYEYKNKVFSLNEDEKMELAEEMFNICSNYTTIEQFEKACAKAFDVIAEPVPGYGGGIDGGGMVGGGTSNTVESAGTIRT